MIKDHLHTDTPAHWSSQPTAPLVCGDCCTDRCVETCSVLPLTSPPPVCVQSYLKLAYLVKIVRAGRQYYLGVGLSDVPLMTTTPDDLLCSSDFSGPCAEAWAYSIAGFRMSTLLMAKSVDQLKTNLELQFESTADVATGGSPYGFTTTVLSSSGFVLVSDQFRGNTTTSWLRQINLDPTAISIEDPQGTWPGPFDMRTSAAGPTAPHYLYLYRSQLAISWPTA